MRLVLPTTLGPALLATSSAAVCLGCSGASASNTATGGATASGGSGGTSISFGGSGGGGGSGGKLTQAPPCTVQDPNADNDKDGFTPATGDCNDCTAQMNPGAFDYRQNGVDEDCNGTPDDEPTDCDTAHVDVADADPALAARVIGICRTATSKSWGLVSAKYVKADGTVGMADASHGLLPGFGPNVKPRAGANLLMLSSGTARQPTDPGFLSPDGAEMGTASYTPPGFPIDSPACDVKTASDTTANNPAALELVIRTPTNANLLSFDFNFYTYEFPVFVCTEYNDFFVALANPAPPNAQSGNISFDSQGNPVSVNNGYLEVCAPQTAGKKQFDCKLGTSSLDGTGFEGHAATGWLNTQAPVTGGYELTLRFAIWDMGDEVLDSSVLIDNFTFDVGEGSTPVTRPIPR